MIYKREQPVSVWRSVCCYLRKVLKHTQWQDDRMTLKKKKGKERRGGRSVKRRREEEDENNKVRRNEEVYKLGVGSLRQEMTGIVTTRHGTGLA